MEVSELFHSADKRRGIEHVRKFLIALHELQKPEVAALLTEYFREDVENNFVERTRKC